MSIKERARKTFQNVQCNLTQNIPREFDTPADLHFGDTADPGSSSKYSRGDHRHGMPAAGDTLFNAYLQNGFYFQELMMIRYDSPIFSPQGIWYQGPVSPGPGLDEPGGHGSFGSIQHAIPGAVGLGNGINGVINNHENVVGDLFDARQFNHSPARLRRFETRFLMHKTAGNEHPLSVRIALGGWRSSSGDPDPLAIVNGVYFFTQIGLAGTGTNTWKGRINNEGVVTDVDLGVGFAYDSNSGTVSAQTFTLTNAGGVLSFLIDGVLRGILPSSKLPSTKIAGWGNMWAHDPRTLAYRIITDGLLFRGSR